MPPRSLPVLLLVLSFPVPGICANVWSPNAFFQRKPGPLRKPSPRPTPPPGAPNPNDPGGAKTNVSDRSRPATAGTAVGEPTAGPTGDKSMNRGRANRGRDALSTLGGFDGAKKVGRTYSRDRLRLLSIPPAFNTCNPAQHQEEDLTGTYSGKINFPSKNLNGSATLNIEGRKFTLVSENVVLSGDLASETTCDYTAVAMRFDSTVASPEDVAKTISVQAQAAGSNLVLLSVEGETKFEFIPVSKATRRRRR